MNGAQTSPVAGAEPHEVMPLVSYRASAEAVLRWECNDRVVSRLHEIRKVAGHRQSAKHASNLASRLPSERPRISPDWIGIFPTGPGRCPSREGKSTYQVLTQSRSAGH